MMDYHRQNKVDIRIVRIFNTYGPRMAVEDGRVVSNFIVQALRGRAADGLWRRHARRGHSASMSDLIDGLVRMMDADGFIGPVNLGNPGEFTILELAEKVLRLTGSRSRIVRPLPSDDPVRRCPDISLAKEKLGWEPGPARRRPDRDDRLFSREAEIRVVL